MGNAQRLLEKHGYTKIKTIGSGGQGKAILVKSNQDGENYILKEIKLVLDWFVQICLALKYVHDKNIIHRDIKPQNIFVTMEGTLKLGDFGLAKVLPRSKAFTESCVGTLVYMAPEVLLQRPYNEMSDVWSLGLVLYNMCKLVIEKEFDKDQLHAMGLDGKGSFLKDEEIIVEIISELKENIKVLRAFFHGDHQHLNGQIGHLNEITDELESVHRKTTIGSLTGGVIGVAGGITSIVGLVLAPFTLGASLAVTAVGVGMAAAGSATGAASNIANMVRQKTLRKTIEDILTDFQDKINPVLISVNKINGRVSKMQEYGKLATTVYKLESGVTMGRGAAGLMQVVRLAKAANIGRMAAQATRAVSVAGKLTAVLSSLMLILDVVFIAKDAKEIHEMNKLKKKAERGSNPKMSVAKANEIKSNMLKFINEMRNTARHFENILHELERMKEAVDSEPTFSQFPNSIFSDST